MVLIVLVRLDQVFGSLQVGVWVQDLVQSRVSLYDIQEVYQLGRR